MDTLGQSPEVCYNEVLQYQFQTRCNYYMHKMQGTKLIYYISTGEAQLSYATCKQSQTLTVINNL